MAEAVAPSETSNGEVPACGQDIPIIGKLLAVTCPDKVAAVMAQEAEIYAGYPPITLLVDSGADFHVVGNKDLLLDMEGCTRRLITATSEDMGVIGIGTLRPLWRDNGPSGHCPRIDHRARFKARN